MNRKSFIYGALAVFLSGNTLFAQTQYDVARIIDTDLSGTARFVGMGGAMSALGGDVTTIGTNPAGIALFRSNDVSGTLSLTNTQVESNFEGIQSQENRTRMSLDQFGVVLSNPIDDANVRFVNIGMNYRKVRNFSKKMTVYGDLLGMSLTDQIARMTNNDEYGNYNPLPLDDYYKIYNELGGNYYGSAWSDVSWLGVLGIQGRLIGPEIDDDGVEYEHYIGMEGVADRYNSRETGGVNVFDVNMSANVDDRVYLGLTVGFHNVDYNRSSSYTEWGRFNRMDTEYLLKNDFMTEGAGVNAKLGVIFRPFVESAFRMGLAVHTPTLYKLSDRHWASLSSSLDNYYGETDVAQFDYELLTPWKVNFSLGR